MEKSAIDLIGKKVVIRMNDFMTRINQLIINKNLGLSLYEIEQLLNRKITSPDPLPKDRPKYIPFYSEVGKIYCTLEVYNYILPEYNEIWLLYGKGNMFKTDNKETTENDFVTRFNEFKKYATENVTFLEDSINLHIKDFYHDNINNRICENQIIHFLNNNIITEFANVFAGINKLKLKLKLKDLNIAWLLSGEGDMFEKTEN